MKYKAVFKEIARWFIVLVLLATTIIAAVFYDLKSDVLKVRKRVGLSPEDTTDILTIDFDIVSTFNFENEEGWYFNASPLGTPTSSSSGVNTGNVLLYPSNEDLIGTESLVSYSYILEDLELVFPVIVRGPKYIVTLETMVFYDGALYDPYDELQVLALFYDGVSINNTNNIGVKNSISFIVDTSNSSLLSTGLSINHILAISNVRQKAYEILYSFNITTWGITQNASQEEYIEIGRQEVINNPNEYNLYTNQQYNQFGQLKYNEGYDEGYDEGSTFGESIGFQNGVREGYNEGYDHGYNAGYEVGEYDGEQNGYNAGYQDGYSEGRIEEMPLGLEWVESSFNVVTTFLNIMILPGVTLGHIFAGIIILIILAWVLAWFRG